MPPPALMDMAQLDCSRVLFTRPQIYTILPQAGGFSQLDGIIHLNVQAGICAGYRDVRPDEWWCPVHLPGNPIFPGVLMMETAAQLAAFAQHHIAPAGDGVFMGFGGVDRAKFRGSVVPPSRIILVGKMVEARSRRFVCDVQAHLDGAMVFEGLITGMPLKR